MKQGCRGVIFDIDGVLEFQAKVYPEAVELLDSLRKNGSLSEYCQIAHLKVGDHALKN